MGSKGKTTVAAPDYTEVAAASKAASADSLEASKLARTTAQEQLAEARRQADQSNTTAQEQLAWARDEFAQNKELLEKVLSVQLPIMQDEAAEGKRLRARYNEVFQPIEDQLVKESNEYASGARSDFDAGRALADVGQAFEASRSNALARLESYGVDPSQTRTAALDAGIRTQEAAAKAAAGTQSRLNTENTGRALRGEAINLGKGLPTNIAGAYGTAQAAGQAGFGNALGLTSSGASSMGTGQGWSGNAQGWAGQGGTAAQWAGTGQGYAGTANSALGNWGNVLNSQQSGYNAAQQQKASSSSGMGSALGGIAGSIMGGPLGGMAGTALGGLFERGMTNENTGGGGLAKKTGGEIPIDPADPEGVRDTIPAALSGGEFIIPASAVRRLGSDRLEKMIAKFGDPEDRDAAMTRMKTGAPGGRRQSAMGVAA